MLRRASEYSEAVLWFICSDIIDELSTGTFRHFFHRISLQICPALFRTNAWNDPITSTLLSLSAFYAVAQKQATTE